MTMHHQKHSARIRNASQLVSIVCPIGAILGSAVFIVTMFAAVPVKAAFPVKTAVTAKTAQIEEVILAALEREKGLLLVEATLEEIASIFNERFRWNTVVDYKALDDDAISPSVTFSLDVPELSFKSALAIALDECDLSYAIWNGSLILTTKTACDEKTQVCTYSVSKHIHPAPVAVRAVHRYGTNFNIRSPLADVADVIQTVVSPDEWDENGGHSTIDTHGTQIVVAAPLRLQDEVSRLLIDWERAEKGNRGKAVRSLEHIRQKLSVPVDLDVGEMSLDELARFCRRITGVPFLVDRKALEEDAISPDTMVSGSLRDLPLGLALRLILNAVDLTWVVRDDVVFMTTMTGAEKALIISCFPVSDLTAGSPAHAEELVELIENNVAVVQWEMHGGNSNVRATPSNRVLMVSATESVTERVELFLAQLRRDWNPESLARQTQQVTTAFYSVHAPGISASQVVAFLKSDVSGIRWDNRSACTVLGERIVVRHRPKEQAKVESLLWEFQLLK